MPLTINRIAVTLLPTEACLDWINSCDPNKMTLDEIQQEPTVFLLPEGRDEPELQVRHHYKAMFEEELTGVVLRYGSVAQRPLVHDIQAVFHDPGVIDGV